jgi:hypothetical protein
MIICILLHAIKLFICLYNFNENGIKQFSIYSCMVYFVR